MQKVLPAAITNIGQNILYISIIIRFVNSIWQVLLRSVRFAFRLFMTLIFHFENLNWNTHS